MMMMTIVSAKFRETTGHAERVARVMAIDCFVNTNRGRKDASPKIHTVLSRVSSLSVSFTDRYQLKPNPANQAAEQQCVLIMEPW